MAKRIETIQVEATFADRFSAGLNKVNQNLRRWEGNFRNVGRAADKALGPLNSRIAGLAASIASAATAVKAMDVAKVQIQAERRLLTALQGNNKLLKERLDFASKLQQQGIFGDETVIEAEIILRTAGVGDDKIDEALQAAADRAAQTGESLEQNARNLAKTLSGMAGQIGRIEPELQDLTVAQLKAGAAIDLMAEKYAGANANLASTDPGRATQAANRIGDAYESLGKSLLFIQAAVLPKVAEQAEKAVAALESPQGQKFISDVADALSFVVDHADEIVIAIGALKGVSVGAGLAANVTIAAAGLAKMAPMLVKGGPILGALAATAVTLGGISVLTLEIGNKLGLWKDNTASVAKLFGDIFDRIRDGSLTIVEFGASVVGELKKLDKRFEYYLWTVPTDFLGRLLVRAKAIFDEMSQEFVVAFKSAIAEVPGLGKPIDLPLVGKIGGLDIDVEGSRKKLEQLRRDRKAVVDQAAADAEWATRDYADALAAIDAETEATLAGIRDQRNEAANQASAEAIEQYRKQKEQEREAEKAAAAESAKRIAELERQALRDLIDFRSRAVDAEAKLREAKERESLDRQLQQGIVATQRYYEDRKRIATAALDAEMNRNRGRAIALGVEAGVATLQGDSKARLSVVRELAGVTDELRRLDAERQIILRDINAEQERALRQRQEERDALAGGLDRRLAEANEDPAALRRIELAELEAQHEVERARAKDLLTEAEREQLVVVQQAEQAALKRKQALQQAEAAAESAADAESRYRDELQAASAAVEAGSITEQQAREAQSEALESYRIAVEAAAAEMERLAAAAVAAGDPELARQFLDNADKIRQGIETGTPREQSRVGRFGNRPLDAERVGEDVDDVGRSARSLVASGVADALTDIASKAKSAGEAFRDMAAAFAQAVARMLIEKAALMMVDMALSAFGVPPGVGSSIGNAAGIGKNKGGIIPGFSGGGHLPDDNGPNRDRVLAALTPGEYVLPRDVVRTVGVAWLERLRRSGRRAHQVAAELQGFNVGGYVEAWADQWRQFEPSLPSTLVRRNDGGVIPASQAYSTASPTSGQQKSPGTVPGLLNREPTMADLRGVLIPSDKFVGREDHERLRREVDMRLKG